MLAERRRLRRLGTEQVTRAPLNPEATGKAAAARKAGQRPARRHTPGRWETSALRCRERRPGVAPRVSRLFSRLGIYATR